MKNLHKTLLTFVLFLMTGYAFATNFTDSEITTAVKNKLATDNTMVLNNISVSTSKGVVSLSGQVDSETAASQATQLAESTPGVKDVDTSHLSVKGSSQPMSDALITAKIKGRFIQQELFGSKDVDSMGIKVETNNGVVTLSGTAETKEQIQNAASIVKSVKGVKSVKTLIQLNSQS